MCLTSYTASVLVMVGSTIATNQISTVAASLMSTPAQTPLHLPCRPITEPSLSAEHSGLVSHTIALILPQNCLNNETATRDETSLWNIFFDSTSSLDVKNHTFPKENGYVDESMDYFIKKKNEWTEQKDWLTVNEWTEQKDWLKAISNIVATHPSTILPVEILTY